MSVAETFESQIALDNNDNEDTPSRSGLWSEVIEGWRKKRSLSPNENIPSHLHALLKTDTDVSFGTYELDQVPQDVVIPRNRTTEVFPRELKLQEWEGQVQSVEGEYFVARLVDITADETAETEEVELPIDDLSEGDQSLIVPGAIFRWIIGYRYQQGTKERFARVIVRRLPVWTDEEIEAADKIAEEQYELLNGSTPADIASSGRD